jgi:DUF917 family protein
MLDGVRRWTRIQSRRVGGAALVGVVLATLAAGTAAVVTGDAEGVTELLFSLGTLVFGFAVVGWAGSVMAGRGFENLQKHLSTGSQWTERDSRRAMSRIGGFGAGGMIGASLASLVLV